MAFRAFSVSMSLAFTARVRRDLNQLVEMPGEKVDPSRSISVGFAGCLSACPQTGRSNASRDRFADTL